MKKYCCDTMRHQVMYRCDQHPNPFDCPDNLIMYSERSDDYALIIHDGMGYSTGSLAHIRFCPWCGTDIETTRRIKQRLRVGKRTSEHYRALSLDDDALERRYPLRKELLTRHRKEVAVLAEGILAGEIMLAEGARKLSSFQRSVTNDSADEDFTIFNMVASRLEYLEIPDNEKGKKQAEELYAEFYKDAILDACRRLVTKFDSKA